MHITYVRITRILILLGVGIPLMVLYLGITSWKFILWGAALWAIGVGIKIVGGPAINTFIKRITPKDALQGMLWGLWSAACELGLAALFFSFYVLSLQDAIGFGIGAGCIEILFILCTLFWEMRKQKLWHEPLENESTIVLERVLALIGHISSRGLVWLGCRYWIPILFLGIVLFTIVDGVASLSSWKWERPGELKKFYYFLTMITFIEGLLLCIKMNLV